ncbi:unnamed protein product [Clonostachys chloroleuca]|uniref:Uncharacterized protein n=1 Tax=Clonostachys chloroleuca TaxID=1926264 RepID=A0AA35M5Q0_9HYPO|nr:unnamed protein product [Clonostachys chloroleuca]
MRERASLGSRLGLLKVWRGEWACVLWCRVLSQQPSSSRGRSTMQPQIMSIGVDGQTQIHLAGLGALTTAIQTLSKKIKYLDPLGNNGTSTLTASKRYATREDDESASDRHPKRIRVQDDHQSAPRISSKDSSPSAI